MSRRKPSLNYIDWYKAVKLADGKGEDKLMDVLSTAIGFFEEEQQNAQNVFEEGDKLVDVMRNHMQYTAYYNNLHTQLVKLDEFYARKLKRVQGKILSKWDKDPPTNFILSKADKSYLLEDHPDVIEATEIYDIFNTLLGYYTKIIDSFTSVGFTVGHLTKLRAAGQEEAVL